MDEVDADEVLRSARDGRQRGKLQAAILSMQEDMDAGEGDGEEMVNGAKRRREGQGHGPVSKKRFGAMSAPRKSVGTEKEEEAPEVPLADATESGPCVTLIQDGMTSLLYSRRLGGVDFLWSLIVMVSFLKNVSGKSMQVGRVRSARGPWR